MTHSEMFGNAKWIQFKNGMNAPYVRSDFRAEKFSSAKITICGLGMFELYLNGNRVSDDLFNPVTSDYVKREIRVNGTPFDEEMRHRIYCVDYDVTEYLRVGENKLAVWLGAGWFDLLTYSYDEDVKFGNVCLCYKLELSGSDGSVQTFVSDEGARYSQSPIVKSGLYEGEVHDYNAFCKDDWKSCDISDWDKALLTEPPQSEFYIQNCPADQVIRRIVPKRLESFLGTDIYDVGENITGWVVLDLDAPKGGEVSVHFSEELNTCGALNVQFCHGQKWEIISDGTVRSVHPHFTWYGFRYFSVSGNAVPKFVEVIHSNVPVNSAFRCSDDILNWFYDTYLRTQLTNMHTGIPSDCPHIERRGYTGDGQLICQSAMLLLDSKAFFYKWIDDILDCQDIHTGHVQNTAPYMRAGGGPGGWGSAVVHVPLSYYYQYGDQSVLKKAYPHMLKYLGYLQAHSVDGIVSSDRAGEWCLGDWVSPGEVEIPPEYVNTYFHIKSMQNIELIEDVLGIPHSDKDRTGQKRLIRAFEKRFYDEKSGNYCANLQGANAFAIDIGLGNERTLFNLVQHYREVGGYDTGIFGTEILTRVLFEKGYGDLAYALISSKNPVSFHRWRSAGATTFWETWPGENERSHNHPMFGAITYLFFRYILGIRQQPSSCGWEEVSIAPQLTREIPCAAGHITTCLGKVGVTYQTEGEKVRFVIEIPQNMQAFFCYKAQTRKLKAGCNNFEFEKID